MLRINEERFLRTCSQVESSCEFQFTYHTDLQLFS
jgi:hypothetical protein